MICGIDPGLSGAVCSLGTGKAIFVIDDMPVHALKRGGKQKREIDIAALADVLNKHGEMVDHVFLEQVGAMPGQGVSSMFSLGKTFGIILGILGALRVPYTLVPAVRWKKALGVPAAKDGARARASQLLPHAAHCWTRVRDDGRAESALIALYGLRTLGATA